MRTWQIIQSLMSCSYGTGDLVITDGYSSSMIGSLPWKRDGPLPSPFPPPKKKETQAHQGGVGGVSLLSIKRPITESRSTFKPHESRCGLAACKGGSIADVVPWSRKLACAAVLSPTCCSVLTPYVADDAVEDRPRTEWSFGTAL